jgi:hypothetical protein
MQVCVHASSALSQSLRRGRPFPSRYRDLVTTVYSTSGYFNMQVAKKYQYTTTYGVPLPLTLRLFVPPFPPTNIAVC